MSKVFDFVTDTCHFGLDYAIGGAKLDTQLSYQNAKDHPVETGVKMAVSVGLTIGCGIAGKVAAPVIAAYLGKIGMLGATASGTKISTLKGIALINASLKKIGGKTMKSGVTRIAITSATGGNLLGNSINKYIGDLSDNNQHNNSSSQILSNESGNIKFYKIQRVIEYRSITEGRDFDDVLSELLSINKIKTQKQITQKDRIIAYKAWIEGREIKDILAEKETEKSALNTLIFDNEAKRHAEKHAEKINLLMKKYENKTPLELQRLAEHKAWSQDLNLEDVLSKMEAEKDLIKSAPKQIRNKFSGLDWILNS